AREQIVGWLVPAKAARLAISQNHRRTVPAHVFAGVRAKFATAFTLDSSQYLNCHSNFIPMIAPVRRGFAACNRERASVQAGCA
ncbi:MAG TPA: hypothetical protein VMI47_07860, partial [Pseudolabrys sp.]|nr:hypothetical protein [Pseudolabrys sp.]